MPEYKRQWIVDLKRKGLYVEPSKQDSIQKRKTEDSLKALRISAEQPKPQQQQNKTKISMKWAEGIDKLGLGLYFLLCIFAIANINSVDAELGKKQLIFFGISVFVGIIIFSPEISFSRIWPQSSMLAGYCYLLVYFLSEKRF